MRKMVSVICVIFMSTSLNAEEISKKAMIEDLIKIEIPNPYIKSGKIELTPEQKVLIIQKVKPLMHDVYQVKMNEAFGLERRVQKAVMQGKSKEEIKPMLNKIAQLKIEAMNAKIEVLSLFHNILTPEQWNKFNNLIKDNK